MSNWLEPIPNIYKNSSALVFCEKFQQSEWFPNDGAIKCTDKGSIEMDILPAFVKHLNKFVRLLVPEETYYLLSLDVHGSINGFEWVEECHKSRCEVVVSAANTSHFLQPCDQMISKKFNSAIRGIRDEFNKSAVVPTRSVKFNLVCGVHGFESVSVDDIRQSFRKAGIFPFNHHFSERFNFT